MAITMHQRVRHVEGVLPPRQALGATLATVGLIVLAAFIIHDLQRWTLVLVSVTCLAAFALTREYAFGVVAGITGGMGAGLLILTGAITIATLTPLTAPGWLLLGVGSGFVSAWVLGWLAAPAEQHPWPLVPGLLIGSIGAAIAGGQPSLIDWTQATAAILLVVAGSAALLRHAEGRTAAHG